MQPENRIITLEMGTTKAKKKKKEDEKIIRQTN